MYAEKGDNIEQRTFEQQVAMVRVAKRDKKKVKKPGGKTTRLLQHDRG